MKFTDKNIARSVFALSAVVVAAFAISNFLMLHSAGTEADSVQVKLETALVRNEINRQAEKLVRDQSQISQWDASVEALGEEIDQAFVNEEISYWMWEDFGILYSIVVSPELESRVVVWGEETLDTDIGTPIIEENNDLILLAQNKYMENRQRAGAGYQILNHLVRSDISIHATGLRMVNGELGIVAAQAIVPDEKAVLPDGLPQVLLTFKPLEPEALEQIGNKLNLTNFAIEPIKAVADNQQSLILQDDVGAQNFMAVWTPSRPSIVIWQSSFPRSLLLLALISAVLLFIATRHSKAVTVLRVSEQKNRFLALHDAMTGLPNRMHFDGQLEEIVARGLQNRCAIMCLDLDRFKAVNDTYGHQAGDKVITTVAERIAECVGDKGMAARIGGDEFIILLWKELDEDRVRWLCDMIIESVCKEIPFDGGTASVGASIGVAWWPEDGLTAKAVIRAADAELYRAKENGRGMACLSTERLKGNGELRNTHSAKNVA